MLLKKKTIKGLSFILTISIIGAGSFSNIPTVFADSDLPSLDQEIQLSNTLSNLEIEGAALDQAFSSSNNTYSAIVENGINTVQLLVAATAPDSTITINGQNVTDGKSGPLSLQTGENTFLITVNDGKNPPNTYTLTVTRKKNENNLLKDLKLSKGDLTPKFLSSITDYNVAVANEVESINVTPEAAESTSSIKVNDTVAGNEGVSVRLPIGKSDITIFVTAEDGTQKTYVIHINRAAKPTNNPPGTGTGKGTGTGTGTKPGKGTGTGKGKGTRNGTYARTGTNPNLSASGNFNSGNAMQQSNSTVQKTSTATLSSLTVSEGTWDSSFSKEEYTYHIAISSNVKTITLNPTATYSSAVVTIEGGSSKTVSLTDNKTVIPVLVTRGEDRKTYVLVFNKPSQPSDTTTVSTQQPSDTSVTSPSTSNTTTVSGTTEQKIRKSKTPKTFWEKIAAFFKKIF